VRAKFTSEWGVRNLLNAVDLMHLTLLPTVPLVKLLTLIDVLPDSARMSIAPLASFLQISLALRALQYLSLFRSFGPVIVAVASMLADILSFVGLYVFIVLGFANGFYVLFGGAVDFSTILERQLLWVLGSIDLGFFDSLAGSTRDVALLLFWSYTGLSAFVMINLLIAIFNSTYERVGVEREAEWLWLRLEAMLDFESDVEVEGVDEFYTQLEELNNKRAVQATERR